MKFPCFTLGVALAAAMAAAHAQPATEAVDPGMIRARDWLQQLDRGEFEQALVGVDERLTKRGAERLAADVDKARKGVAMPTCRAGLYVEVLNDGSEASFVARYGDTKVTEKVTLKYDSANVLHPSDYKVTGAPKDNKACNS